MACWVVDQMGIGQFQSPLTRWEYEWLRLYSGNAFPHSFAGNEWRCSAVLSFGVLGPVQRHLLKPPRHTELGRAAKWLEGHGWKCLWCLHSGWLFDLGVASEVQSLLPSYSGAISQQIYSKCFWICFLAVPCLILPG